MLTRYARNERDARALMSQRYSRKPKLRPGAFYVKRRTVTVDDWQMLGGYALGVFNLLLWGYLLTAIFKGPT